jgi:hypothetical protein
MKRKIILFSIIIGVAWAKPSKNFSKYTLNQKLGLQNIEFYSNFKRFDGKNKSVFEFCTFEDKGDRKTLFTSDSLFGSYQNNMEDMQYVKYFVFKQEMLDSLKSKITMWENRIFTRDFLNFEEEKEVTFDSTFKVLLNYNNKLDQYYEATSADPQFEKGMNVYVPWLVDATFVHSGRKHHMTFREFRRTFDLNKDF